MPEETLPTRAGLVLYPDSFLEVPGWSGGRQSEAIPALLTSCARLEDRPGPEYLGGDHRLGRYVDWRLLCIEAARLPPENDPAARQFLVRNFVPYLVGNEEVTNEGLFTGYYEAEVRASRTPSARYRVPVMGRPRDLVSVDLGDFRDEWTGKAVAGRVVGNRLEPHFSRAEIMEGALKEQYLGFLWADDPVDMFFLQVQGSGRAVLPDGKVIRLAYDGSNGHPYRSIGKVLIDEGEVSADSMSMQAIRSWILAHPGRMTELLKKNPSYIYFKENPGPGPVGAQGTVLVAGRSLAVDDSYLPYGLPLWLDTTHPLDDDRPLRRLVVAQDTGSAITGPVRGDLFWGHGPEAERLAGRMKSFGRYWILAPRPPGL